MKTHQILLPFFQWFDSEKTINVQTKTKPWKIARGKDSEEIESIHPPLTEVMIPYKGVEIKASPFKVKENLNEISGNDIKNIYQQNNYANQCLNTISEQLNRIKDVVAKPILKPIDERSKPLKIVDNKPLFIPHEIPPKHTKTLTNKEEFMQEINRKLNQIKEEFSSVVAPDTPQTSKHINFIGKTESSESSETDDQNTSSSDNSIQINNMNW